MAGEKPDRIPVLPIVREWACMQAGISFNDTMENAEKHVYSQYYAARAFGYDAVFDLSGIHAESEAMGSQIEYGKGLLPTIKAPAIKDYDEDLPKLKIPDPRKDGRLPLILDGIRRLKDLCGGEIPVIGYVQCPFRHACMLRGGEQWIRDIFKDKKNAKKLIEMASESLIVWAKAVVLAGADILCLADPFSSGSVISTRTLSEWSLPYMKRLCSVVKETGVKTYLHVCGDISDRLEMLASLETDILQIDSKVDLGLARETLGPDQLLMGNVDPSDPLALGTPEDVYRHSKRAIEKAGKGGRLLLSGGCMISGAVPAKNMEAMVRAAHEARL